MSLETLLQHLLTQRNTKSLPPFIDSVEQWWSQLQTIMPQWSEPIDQAIASGFSASCIGYAFVSGYQTALRRMLPTLPNDKVVSLCVTEEKGNHPKVLETSLTAVSGQWVLNGRKKWASLSNNSGLLLVAAVRGTLANGQNEIILVQVPIETNGVTVHPMPPTPFVPEVTHGQIQLDDVIVPETAVLPHDGYTHYIKPFRTIEDTFVSAAVASLLLRTAFAHDWDNQIIDKILSIIAIFRTVGTANYHDPTIHILLEGALTALGQLADPAASHWENVPAPDLTRWQRDIPLLKIARTARTRRYERAWQLIDVTGYNVQHD
ncbi:MAG: acyl-CoA dehydrogenase family protein [Chloroflexota bacterium]